MRIPLIIVAFLASHSTAIWPFDDDSSTTPAAKDQETTSEGLLDWIGGFFNSETSSAQQTGGGSDDGSSGNAVETGDSNSTSGSDPSDEDSSSTDTEMSATTEATSSLNESEANPSKLSKDFSSNVLFTADEISSTQSDNYEPYYTTCPTGKLIRRADSLSNGEKEYLEGRKKKTKDALEKFLKDADVNFPADNITVGLAFSGGGYRAMLAGAGQLLALDDRFDDSNDHGLGGLLQSSTYLVGLSGGNWLVGTLALNDWISLSKIWEGYKDIWNLDETIFNQGGWNLLEVVKFYTEIGKSIDAKKDAGFDVSITDVWGRALSYQFFPSDTDGNSNASWSDIREMASFKNHEMPFPIVVANGRTPGTLIINENSTVFEVNPFELGSWDPSLGYMSDVKYLGTQMHGGEPVDSESCVVKFDSAGFIMGTSSSLFNQALLRTIQSNLPSILKSVVQKILGRLSYDQVDVANYRPNPFFRAEDAGVHAITDNSTLFLVDGGEDMQNVPYYPLIQQARKVDVIISYDNSADTDKNWPNGTSIAATYQRQFSPQGKGSPFPFVPNVAVQLKNKMNEVPVFYGCDAKNLSILTEYHGNSREDTDIPLVVYIPNSYYNAESNTSTFKMYYDTEDKYTLFENGFGVSTRGNFTADQGWKTCLACAIVRRSQERNGDKQSDECAKCFERYCWRGTAKDSVYDSDFEAFLREKGEKAPPKSDLLAEDSDGNDTSGTDHSLVNGNKGDGKGSGTSGNSGDDNTEESNDSSNSDVSSSSKTNGGSSVSASETNSKNNSNNDEDRDSSAARSTASWLIVALSLLF
ncbi:lysophospholipase 2 [Diutina catenulata]